MPRALGVIARQRNLSELARCVGMSRDGLYKALSDQGNVTWSTVPKVCDARTSQHGVDLVQVHDDTESVLEACELVFRDPSFLRATRASAVRIGFDRAASPVGACAFPYIGPTASGTTGTATDSTRVTGPTGRRSVGGAIHPGRLTGVRAVVSLPPVPDAGCSA
ncbi:MAG: addiction module antidote protein [Arachnia sp.]